jgi:hypothetical protein
LFAIEYRLELLYNRKFAAFYDAFLNYTSSRKYRTKPIVNFKQNMHDELRNYSECGEILSENISTMLEMFTFQFKKFCSDFEWKLLDQPIGCKKIKM